jgi:hypothetical protein
VACSNRFRNFAVVLGSVALSCAISCSGPPPRVGVTQVETPAAERALSAEERGGVTPPQGDRKEPASEASGPKSELSEWLTSRVPAGGSVVVGADGAVSIVHTVRSGETFTGIADTYLDLTDIYLLADLAIAIRKENGLANDAEPQAGARLAIPGVVKERWKSTDEERLGWPSDKVLRGLYVRGLTAGGPLYMRLLAHMAERPLNLIVLDTKDYDGLLTYPSKVPLANEIGATKGAPIRDLARAIRFAHARGIRVAMRISCFEDELLARTKGDLSVQSVWHRPYRIGWLDPSNPDAQQYIIDLANEAMDAGADEIELDYVRYPVVAIKDADFNLAKRKLTKKKVVTEFVRKVHAVTKARGVPLSLDIFGIISEGVREDIENLGQDPVLLAKECEALSPMVYPSHFRSGYQGFEIPGNHPEIVGISTRKIVQQIKRAHVRDAAVVRPWLQAASYNSPDYGPPWVASEVRAAESSGAFGWLMWNPVQTYTVTWNAVPRSKAASSPRVEAPKGH